MEISAIKQRLFNTSKYEKSVSRQSNPFTTFKGNVLSADVFESSSTTTNNKLTASALVGSMTAFGAKLKEKWNTIISFGGTIKQKIVTIASTELDMPTFKAIGDFLNVPLEQRIFGYKYETMPIAQLKNEFSSVVNALESGNF